jgi:lysophospholipase L1-like esterase
MNRIGVWGDSITWGAADQELGGWVNRLRLYVENNYKDGPSAYNLGVSGDKVSNVLDRFDAEYKARQPETVILAIGINDSPHESYPNGTSLEVFEKSFRELLSKARSVAKKIVIVGIINVDDGPSTNHGYSDQTIEPYNQTIKKIADQNSITYVDLRGLITKHDLKLDGLHPDSAGHEKIYKKVKQVLVL